MNILLNKENFKPSLYSSLCLHLVLLVLLSLSFSQHSSLVQPTVESAVVVQASAIDQQQVQRQVQNVIDQRNAAERARKARIQAIQAAKQKKAAAAAKALRIKQAQVAKRKAQQQAKLKQQQLAKQKAIQAAKAKEQALQVSKAKALAKQQALLKQQQLDKKIAELQRQQADHQLSTDHQQIQQAKAQYQQGIIDEYRQKVAGTIGRYWYVSQDIDKNLTCKFLIRLAPDGTVISAKLLSSSGNQALDQSAKVAIFKASPLPVPKEPEIFDKFREFSLIVSPQDVIMRSRSV